MPYLTVLPITDVLLTIEEPLGYAVLEWILHHSSQLLDLLLTQLPSSLAHVDIGLLAHEECIAATHSLNMNFTLSTYLQEPTPTPTLIAVRAYGTFSLPLMFVFKTRWMCWKLAGSNSDDVSVIASCHSCNCCLLLIYYRLEQRRQCWAMMLNGSYKDLGKEFPEYLKA